MNNETYVSEDIQDLIDWVKETKADRDYWANVLKGTRGAGPGHHQLTGAEISWSEADRDYREAKRALADAMDAQRNLREACAKVSA